MDTIQAMPTPTFVVGKEEFNKISVENVSEFIIHGRRGLKIVPPQAQEVGENVVFFLGSPKQIVFRKRFSRKKCVRNVAYIMADNSDRFDLIFKVIFK